MHISFRLTKNSGFGGTYLIFAKYAPDSTYAKSFIKLPLDEADECSL